MSSTESAEPRKTRRAFGKQRERRRTGAGQVLSEGNLCWHGGVGHVQEYTSKYTSAGQKICISCNQEVTEAKKCTGAVFLARCFYCEVRYYVALREPIRYLLSRRLQVRFLSGAPYKTRCYTIFPVGDFRIFGNCYPYGIHCATPAITGNTPSMIGKSRGCE